MASQFNVKTTLNPNDGHRYTVQSFFIELTHSELDGVAKISGLKVLRQSCRGSFSTNLYEYGLERLATEVFDKFGHLRPWLIDGGTRRGTGCWGKESDSGALIYVMNIDINQEWRSRAEVVKSWMMYVVQTLQLQNGDMLVYDPPEYSTQTALYDSPQISFLQKTGFRRIGRTAFLGYAIDPSHPSRRLSAEADAAPQHEGFDKEDLHTDELKLRFPLHFSIVTIERPEVCDVIKAFHTQDPSSIHQADSSGFTPIYTALSRANLPAVQTLLELGVAEDLVNTHNKEGMTALEKLESVMRSSREFSEALEGYWNGYSEDELRCQFWTKRVIGLPTGVDNESEYIAKRKSGCTCGNCAGGWLSRRMRLRLEYQAEMLIDLMERDMDQFKWGQAIRDPIVELSSAADYLPPQLYGYLFKAFYKGYQFIFDAVERFLSTSDAPLSVAGVAHLAIQGSGESGLGFYLGKGGKYEYALDAVIGVAKDQSELMADMFDETEDYAAIPSCENDLEFALVRRMAGLNPGLPWGPYNAWNVNVHGDSMIGVLSAGAGPEFMQELERRIRLGETF